MKASLPGGFFFANFEIMNSLAFIAIITLDELCMTLCAFQGSDPFSESYPFHMCRVVYRIPLSFLGFPVTQMVKNLPAMQEIWVRSLGQEDPLEKGMATHSSILAWRISWTEEPSGLQSLGLQRVRHD